MSVEDVREAVRRALWRLLGEREALNPGPLIRRVSAETGLDALDVQQALGALRREKFIEGVSDQGMPFAQVKVLVKRPVTKVSAAQTAWRKALDEAGFGESDAALLETCHERLAGMKPADFKLLATGLVTLRGDGQRWSATPAFVVSARTLLHSSKLLSAFPPTVLTAVGIDVTSFTAAPPYVVVAGPPAPRAIILIENPHAFEHAVEAGLAEHHALLVTFGYGLNRRGEDFGRQLAAQLTGQPDTLLPLRRAGDPPSICAMLKHDHLFFWGDLDPEGLRIYARLRSRHVQLRLSALYRPMAEALRLGPGHPYIEATGKAGQLAPREGEVFPDDALRLLPLCAQRGFDQESLDVACYVDLARVPF